MRHLKPATISVLYSVSMVLLLTAAPSRLCNARGRSYTEGDLRFHDLRLRASGDEGTLPNLTLELGAKTDPAEYRFSYEWLFRLLAEEGVRFVQLGTFFEIYQLPDEYFLHLRRQAEDLGVCIQSIFTAHRELGGFFVEEAGWEAVARRNYERLIKVGSLLGSVPWGRIRARSIATGSG